MNKKLLMQIFVILLIILMPAFYAYIFLYAYWDPANYSSNISIAVVNDDKGAEINGEYVNIGDLLEDELKLNSDLKWVFTNLDDAESGVLTSKYYAELIIPNDFTKCISTVSEKNKTQGTLYFKSNDKLGTFASSIISSVSENLEYTVSQTITEKLVDSLIGSVQELPDNFQKLSDGLYKLDNASKQLSQGMKMLTQGQSDFNTNLNLINTSLETLSASTQTLNNTLHSPSLQSVLPADIQNAASTLSYSIQSLSQGANTLNEKSQLILSSEQNILNGVNQINLGIEKIKSTVDISIKQLKNSNSALEGYSKYVSDPIKIEATKIGETKNTGMAMTPFMISLCLWLGGLMLIIIFNTIDKLKFKEFTLYIKKVNIDIGLFRFQLLAIIQSVCLAFTVNNILGMQIENTAQFYGICILGGVTFITIIQVIVLIFKDLGKLLSIIFMLLQLTASGGMMSMELVPAFYKNIHPYMPMTYTINALRDNILSMNIIDYSQSMSVLTITLICGLFLTIMLSLLHNIIRNGKEKHQMLCK